MPATTTIESLDALLRRDIDYMHAALADEFADLAGRSMLITGGAGFIGYYLVKAVLAWNRRPGAGAPVSLTVLDNFARGCPAWLDDHRDDPNLSLMTHDVRQPLPDGFGDYDYIVHAAGIASPIYYRAHPVECIDANLIGLRSILDYAVARRDGDRPVRSILFYSSSEIYGDPAPEMIPTPEDYRGNVSCTGPRACYDESKRMGETLCVTFFRQEGTPVKMARPFNNYGPGLKITDRRVIPDFARDVLAGRDIVMFSDGAPRRTFCYIADAVIGYYKVLLRGHDGEAYNVGIDRPEISMAELAENVAALARDLYGYRGKVIRGESQDQDYLVDNPNRRCPSIEKARTQLGYAPSVLVDEGLRRSMVWYGHNREGTEA